MARTKEFDQEHALAEAMELFWRRGYEATSIRDLTGRLGISSSSLYATFGDKHEMFLAALARYRQAELEQLRRRLVSGSSVRNVLQSLFTELIGNLLVDEEQRGSFTLNAAVELGGRDPEVAEQLRDHFDDITELLADFLARGQVENAVAHTYPPDDLARFVLNGFYSLAMVAKTYPDRRYMETIAAMTLSLMEP
jgi:TetR/AcrR family transcriptional regulator, transcriptional repressor for nem operon